MANTPTKPQKVTLHTLREMKERGERIAMLTAYDATFARLLDQAGADILLVGDSSGMVVAGHGNTLPVTIEETIYHCRAVARGAERAQIVGDMPFMSYQVSVEEGVRNAGRLVKEGGAEAVKLEGGAEYAELARRLARIGIPVMGHVGLTPQSVHAMGGFKVQGRDTETAERILADARALEEAGCYALVLEGIPRELARRVTEAVTIPTVGIGAGPECDGQVLVIYDLLGMNEAFRPKFVKRYDQLGVRIRTAVKTYVDEVKDGLFPTEEYSFSAKPPRARENATPYGAARAAVAAGGEEPAPAADAPAATGGKVLQHPACGWPRSIDEG
jgi:3-methyl-2-oxobutanoate hydroxymethyltransferase